MEHFCPIKLTVLKPSIHISLTIDGVINELLAKEAIHVRKTSHSVLGSPGIMIREAVEGICHQQYKNRMKYQRGSRK